MKLTRTSEAAAEPQVAKKVRREKPTKKGLDKKLIAGLTGLVFGLCLAAVASFFLHDAYVVKEQQKQLDELAQQKAELASASLQEYFKSLTEKAEFFAGQALLRQAIVKGDKAAIERAERSMLGRLDHAKFAHVFANGEAALDPEHTPPIRFSELSLLQDSERSQVAKIEAAKVNGTWLLHIVVPAREDELSEAVGIVWVCLGIEGIQAVLNQDKANIGEFALFQKFNSQSRPLVTKVGTATLPNTATTSLAESYWELQFTASAGLKAQTHIDRSFVYLLVAVLMCVLSGLGFAAGYLIGRVMEQGANKKLQQGQDSSSIRSKSADDAYMDPMYQKQGLIDVDIAESDEALLGMDDDGDEVSAQDLNLDDDVFDIDDELADGAGFPPEVFRAYDIRGVVDEQIEKEFALSLGRALGSELREQRLNTLVVARDARTHSPHLTEWLVRGVLSTGCNVLNIGTVPTPLMYFALETLDEVSSGVMVTASHNGAKYNGFKVVMNGVARSGEDIQNLRKRMNAKKFDQGQGQEHHHDVIPSYIDAIFSDVALAGELSVVIDAGNGVAGKVAPKLFAELGCRVTPLYCDLDGSFPNHDPDPSVAANLKDLIHKVQSDDADIGIALDGDGDRLTVVSKSGKIYTADRLLMLFASDIISRSPGADVIFDVKSTRHLNACIANSGGRPVMWKTGHSLMKQKMLETGAMIGAEYSGHIFIKDRWFGFDDGMYAAARLLEILSLQGEEIDEAFAAFPETLSTPEIRVPVDESKKFEIIESLKEKANFGDGRLTLLDGVRADFGFGWGLVRASNTGAELTLRFEADDEQSLHKLKSIFVQNLHLVDSSIEINWNQ